MKGMLLYLSVELMRGSPEVIVNVAVLECSELEWMHSYVMLKWPW